MLNLLILAASYLLGSIPFGVIVAKSKGVDILSVGSGNIGATNVTRSLGKQAGAIVLFLDVLKGLLPTLFAGWMTGSADWSMYAGVAASFGHIFSPFLKLKGGKGIATTLGVLIGAAPWVAFFALTSFIIIVAITRYVSLGAIAASVEAVVVGAFYGVSVSALSLFALLVGVIILRHVPNIKRLIAGNETQFSLKGSGGSGSKTGGQLDGGQAGGDTP